MTIYRAPELSVADIAQAIGTLRQLEQQIDAVHQDFLSEGKGPPLPPEVTQFHLKREMVALERQIRTAVISAFGEHSIQVDRFRKSGFVAATSRSLQDGLTILDGFIFDLEQKRLHLLESNGSSSLPGLDAATDLYTESMLRRCLDHELVWSQRQGDPFGLLLLRLSHWPSLKQRYGESIAKELVISIACVLKTSLRGYDFPCRLNNGEFAAMLRQTNGLGMDLVVRRMTANLEAATTRLLPGVVLGMEFACALYPFDAESITGLFSYAADHWTLVTHAPSPVHTRVSK
jgi:diguanylate cyclase (GGDEF)-like protein